MEIVPESEWERLFEKLIKHKGTALIIGATDSGKSTLAMYLIKRLISENIKVSLIDSDVGQSSLGLPGTISMKVFCNEEDMHNFSFDRMSFMGTVNPATNISSIINVTTRMADICRKKSEFTLIDTTGLISGEVGKALKIGKIKAINPENLIAVQSGDELEHILNLIENLNIHRIMTSRMVKIRSNEERFRYRKKKLDSYFSKAEIAEFLLHTNEAKFFYKNKLFSPKDSEFTPLEKATDKIGGNYLIKTDGGLMPPSAPLDSKHLTGSAHTVRGRSSLTGFTEGTIIGLNYNEDTIALGIIVEITNNSIAFRSPIKSLKNINKVVFGDITI